jgi:thiol-disulfide isomerase/thioredoxin
MMQRWAGSAVLASALALCVANGANASDTALQAPGIRYRHAINGDGAAWTTESYRGRLTVVNFWATWCPPCIDELPLLQHFQRKHAESDLRVVGVTALFASADGEVTEDADLRQIQRVLKRHGVTYTNLVAGDGAAWKEFGVEGVPSTVLVDAAGNIVRAGKGIKGTKRVLKKAERILARD